MDKVTKRAQRRTVEAVIAASVALGALAGCTAAPVDDPPEIPARLAALSAALADVGWFDEHVAASDGSSWREIAVDLAPERGTFGEDVGCHWQPDSAAPPGDTRAQIAHIVTGPGGEVRQMLAVYESAADAREALDALVPEEQCRDLVVPGNGDDFRARIYVPGDVAEHGDPTRAERRDAVEMHATVQGESVYARQDRLCVQAEAQVVCTTVFEPLAGFAPDAGRELATLMNGTRSE